MKRTASFHLIASALMALSVFGQTSQRQANIRGGGNGYEGKCTIEVVVDGAAEVQIRGTNASLRTLNGQPAQFRRFDCNAAMPSNPANFHFAGVDGRGRQDLIRDPRNGGAAVVRIEDRDNGSEGYTFDLTWGGNQGDYRPGNQYPGGGLPGQGNQGPRGYGDNGYRPNYRDSDYFRRNGRGFAVNDAIEVCRQEVVQQAARRFRNSNIQIGRVAIDNNPGRNDWVIGTLEVDRGRRDARYNFSCSVDFNTGRVRSVQIDKKPFGR